MNKLTLKTIEKEIKRLSKQVNQLEHTLEILKEKSDEIPLSCFHSPLTALEVLAKYLIEERNLSYKDSSVILDRSYNTVAITYRRTKKKSPERLDISSQEKIPLSIFRDKSLSVLENLVAYLKDEMNLSYHEIAVALKRDDRTIWTVYKRSINKR